MESEDELHAAILADVEDDLPPIVVHQDSMRIIDGAHRLAAARRRGDSTIAVQFFIGPPEDAFLLAVRANTTHGKPLSLPERRNAASRILKSHPEWSDRAIAEVCGLSARTVGTFRCATVQSPQTNVRVGRDGRARPMDTTAARRQAARLMQADPSLSLREVAKATGISPGTVRDVRQRILNGKPPELIRPTSASERAPDDSDRRRRITGADLRADSALQATAQGRELVDWFGSRAITEDEWRPFVTAVPKSRVYLVAQAARTCAETWSNFADSLEALFRRRG